MSRPLTTNQFIARARAVHGDQYDYSQVTYVGTHQKVTVVCREHGPFHQNSNNHLTGNGCPVCSGKKRLDTTSFIAKAQEMHGDTYDYSQTKYLKTHQKVTIVCNEHGPFPQTPKNHLRGQGCPMCGGTRRSTTDEFVRKALETHGNVYDYHRTTYVTNKIPVEIICPLHGAFSQRPMTHLSGGGCERCSSSALQTTAQFIQRAVQKHGDVYEYSCVEYTGALISVDIICKIHGIFSQQASVHLRGAGCPACRSRTFSRKSIRWLDQRSRAQNINIQHAENGGEFRIPGTRLKVDGYCSETKTVYEFHGDAYHGNPLIFRENDRCHPFNKDITAKQLFENTLLREERIRSLGYNLVVLWESEFDLVDSHQ